MKQESQKKTKKEKGRPLTRDQYKKLIAYDGWESVHDVPRDQWHKLPVPFFNSDTIAVVTSGILSGNNFAAMHGIEDIVGGIDWLRLEPEGQRYPGEPEGNAYHFIVSKDINGDLYLHGHYTSCIPIPHHFDEKDLSVYTERLSSSDNSKTTQGDSL